MGRSASSKRSRIVCTLSSNPPAYKKCVGVNRPKPHEPCHLKESWQHAQQGLCVNYNAKLADMELERRDVWQCTEFVMAADMW